MHAQATQSVHLTVVEGGKNETTQAETKPMETQATTESVATPTASSASDRIKRERVANLLKQVLLPMVTFAIVIGIWSFIQARVAPELPTPSTTWQHATELLSNPFYDTGPNDKGIGWQLLYSLGRVAAGFGLAALVGIPLGFIMGMSNSMQTALTPLIQILKPVSPLAWLPIGLLVFKAVDPSAIFVIFITCIWPMIINTATGVKAVPQDFMNVASVLQLNKLEQVRRILLPSAMPYVVTGMRLSLGIAWMVIVAAEMLTGGIGIGFWVWDEWNNLSVPSIIVAIFIIGGVGIVLDLAMGLIQNRFDYTKR